MGGVGEDGSNGQQGPEGERQKGASNKRCLWEGIEGESLLRKSSRNLCTLRTKSGVLFVTEKGERRKCRGILLQTGKKLKEGGGSKGLWAEGSDRLPGRKPMIIAWGAPR